MSLAQPGQSVAAVRPWAQSVPDADEFVPVGVGKLGQAALGEHVVEHRPVQIVQ
jgi:hypothetical protein